ncbi:MAG: hypothetical protein GW903_01265 [Alphaproteobacteria bacterium]|nr:hypothetical protein [Alphaproteobacteria bacterium]NCQ87600.1 hypothetical protein [Alphaproteobacteria bacterium]NCT06469.1 hypothetical protein [Alphaproteobacteria bacterium]
MNKDQIIARLMQTIDTINQAQNDVAAGIIKDLSFMDKDVAIICSDIMKLNPDEAAQVQPIMADMITKLEQLASSLQTYKDKLNQR